MIEKVRTLRILCAFAVAPVLFSCSSDKPALSSASDTLYQWAIIPFEKVDSLNPVLTAGDLSFRCPVRQQVVKWEEKDVFNPAAVVREGKVWLLFRAEDTIGKYAGTSRIGLAISNDGLHFKKEPEPVLYPEEDSLKHLEWEGGIEDPRVIEDEEGRYVMTYTSYDGELARLMLATSNDLRKWKKHGVVLQGKYRNTWSKSGAMVAERIGDRIVAKRIAGKYWMYFGDTNLFLLTSDDLIHWTPVEENGKLKPVLQPRFGYFDSRLVESGPFAIVVDEGILLLYNGMNLDNEGRDTTLAPGAYCGGQALFDRNDPSKVIDRLESSFIKPQKEYEVKGQINQVCFIEGLVPFKGQWFLYYGTADSRIAVAVAPIAF